MREVGFSEGLSSTYEIIWLAHANALTVCLFNYGTFPAFCLSSTRQIVFQAMPQERCTVECQRMR